MESLNHGHNHPRILKTRINFQENDRMEVHKNYLSQYLVWPSHNIASLLLKDLNKIYLPNSGAEANEGAIKLPINTSMVKNTYYTRYIISWQITCDCISNSPENFKFHLKIHLFYHTT